MFNRIAFFFFFLSSWLPAQSIYVHVEEELMHSSQHLIKVLQQKNGNLITVSPKSAHFVNAVIPHDKMADWLDQLGVLQDDIWIAIGNVESARLAKEKGMHTFVYLPSQTSAEIHPEEFDHLWIHDGPFVKERLSQHLTSEKISVIPPLKAQKENQKIIERVLVVLPDQGLLNKMQEKKLKKWLSDLTVIAFPEKEVQILAIENLPEELARHESLATTAVIGFALTKIPNLNLFGSILGLPSLSGDEKSWRIRMNQYGVQNSWIEFENLLVQNQAGTFSKEKIESLIDDLLSSKTAFQSTLSFIQKIEFQLLGETSFSSILHRVFGSLETEELLQMLIYRLPLQREEQQSLGDIEFPLELQQCEGELSSEEEFFWRVKGYRLQSLVKKSLVLLDHEHLLLSGGFELSDASEEKQFARLSHLIDLTLYSKDSPYHFFSDEEGNIHFFEECTDYVLPLRDPQKAIKLIGQIKGLVNQCETQKMGFSCSQLIRENGFNALIHTTRPENLISLLSEKEIKPAKYLKEVVFGDRFGNHEKIFFSLISDVDPASILQFSGQRAPILLFAMESILERYPFHLSLRYPHGLFMQYDLNDDFYVASAHYKNKQALMHLLENEELKWGNELVIQHGVDLKGLMAIYVYPGEKKRLLKELAHKNISPPNHFSWEQLIQELPNEFKRLHNPFVFLLDPYSMNSHCIVSNALKGGGKEGKSILRLICREYPKLHALIERENAAEKYIHKALKRLEEETPFFYSKLCKIDGYEPKRLKTLLSLTLIYHFIEQTYFQSVIHPNSSLEFLEFMLRLWDFSSEERRLAQCLLQCKKLMSAFSEPTEENEALFWQKLSKFSSCCEIPLKEYFFLQFLLDLCRTSFDTELLDSSFVQESKGHFLPKSPLVQQMVKHAHAAQIPDFEKLADPSSIFVAANLKYDWIEEMNAFGSSKRFNAEDKYNYHGEGEEITKLLMDDFLLLRCRLMPKGVSKTQVSLQKAKISGNIVPRDLRKLNKQNLGK